MITLATIISSLGICYEVHEFVHAKEIVQRKYGPLADEDTLLIFKISCSVAMACWLCVYGFQF